MIWRFPKIRGTILDVLINRIFFGGGLYWGTLILGNCQNFDIVKRVKWGYTGIKFGYYQLIKDYIGGYIGILYGLGSWRSTCKRQWKRTWKQGLLGAVWGLFLSVSKHDVKGGGC